MTEDSKKFLISKIVNAILVFLGSVAGAVFGNISG